MQTFIHMLENNILSLILDRVSIRKGKSVNCNGFPFLYFIPLEKNQVQEQMDLPD